MGIRERLKENALLRIDHNVRLDGFLVPFESPARQAEARLETGAHVIDLLLKVGRGRIHTCDVVLVPLDAIERHAA